MSTPIYSKYPASSGSGGSGTGFTAFGTATLVGGTATVSNSSVASVSVIFLSCLVIGGIQGILSAGTITAGTSFVINSTSDADTSTISWGFV
jgi:hypothetical protein